MFGRACYSINEYTLLLLEERNLKARGVFCFQYLRPIILFLVPVLPQNIYAKLEHNRLFIRFVHGIWNVYGFHIRIHSFSALFSWEFQICLNRCTRTLTLSVRLRPECPLLIVRSSFYSTRSITVRLQSRRVPRSSSTWLTYFAQCASHYYLAVELRSRTISFGLLPEVKTRVDIS